MHPASMNLCISRSTFHTHSNKTLLRFQQVRFEYTRLRTVGCNMVAEQFGDVVPSDLSDEANPPSHFPISP